MKIGSVINNDLANGPGVRISIFVSGCPHHCEDCHNPRLWDYEIGTELTEEVIQKIIESVKKDEIPRGISILGGEPMAENNVEGVAFLLQRIRDFLPNVNIWLWSGYTYKELKERNSPYVDEILNTIDTLVDGRFVKSLKSGAPLWRGSSNQKIYHRNNLEFIEVEE